MQNDPFSISCSPPVQAQIQTFCRQVQTIFGNNLVSIYLHGSLAMGCFNPEHSDIDLLVVIRQPMSVEAKRQIIAQILQLSNRPCPIEISFVILSEIHPFEHPLPFDLHYSEMWRQQMKRELTDGVWQRWNDEWRRDPDLTAHLMITNHRGITLYGKPAREVLPSVPDKNYISAILGDYTDAREDRLSNPVYFILNACRVIVYLAERRICSKDEGGIYGLEKFPAEYRGIINHALGLYRGLSPALPFDEQALDRLTEFLDRQIASHGYEVAELT